MPQAVVIGAGPAGCVAAMLLARAGWDVILVEQHRFPRDKVCGECISPLGIKVLRRLDLLASIEQLGAVVHKKTAFYTPGGGTFELQLPRPMLGLSRATFDNLLLDEARRRGATVRQPARCERIETNGLARVHLRDLQSNQLEVLNPHWILLADGKAALLGDRPPPTGEFGIKGHFEHVDAPRDAIEVFGVNGSYGGLARIENSRWNVCFCVPQTRIAQHAGNLDLLFEHLQAENDSLRRKMRPARRVAGWLATPLPRYGLTDHRPDGIIPIGNTAAALEPIGGEGIGLAMRSAELAADMLIRSHPAGRISWSHDLKYRFRRLWRVRRIACRALALGVSLPLLGDFLVQTAADAPPIYELFLRATGKLR